jgi:uncharacterized phage-associated protein
MSSEFELKYLEVLRFLLDPHRANNSTLGATKLMKVLYYADFDHFEQYGVPITGDTYFKRPFGPVPDNALRMLRRLEELGQLKIEWENYGGYEKAVYRTFWESPYQPSRKLISTEERATLERVVDTWKWHSASAIVLASHGEPPWRMVSMGERIPYGLVMYRRDVTPQSDEDEGVIIPERAAS